MAVGWETLHWQEPAGGRLLVSTPLLGDPHFSRAVIYLLEHDGGGTVGVILNRPSHTPVGQVLPDWQDAVSDPAVVFNGGPVQPDGALCLGLSLRPSGSGERPAVERPAAERPPAERPAGERPGADIRPVVDGVVTVDLDGDVARITTMTSRLRVFAGHSGWSAGQLSDELAQGAWWVVSGSPADVFDPEPRSLWRRVLRRQPMPLRLVSTYPGDVLLN